MDRCLSHKDPPVGIVKGLKLRAFFRGVVGMGFDAERPRALVADRRSDQLRHGQVMAMMPGWQEILREKRKAALRHGMAARAACANFDALAPMN